MSRVSSASSRGRAPTAAEVTRLKDTISSLQQEVIQANAATDKATDKLNCLILLVKRAWTGDNTAAIHVAKIIGIAPPDGEDHIVQNTKPKSKTLNNWALLTIGLLNREYKAIEEEMTEQSRAYLLAREGYLDEQMLQNRNSVAQARPNSPNESFKKKSKSRPNSGYRNPLPPTDNGDINDGNNMTWGDLLVDGTAADRKSTGNAALTGLFQLESSQVSNSRSDPDRTNIDFDDPNRYTQPGLFESKSFVGKKQRPKSGVEQKKRDLNRNRPKSAFITAPPQPERPLKYETTRPISGKGSLKPKRDNYFFSSGEPLMRKISGSSPNISDPSPRNPPPMKIKIQRPESIDKYMDDMNKMAAMEEDFSRTAMALQKKLGISSDGMIH
ncbi:unnamed protein product [Owenia fusiformis]|uniref:Uncharacterized protein n=1 Tax=Owenia fusiformis TaxID=6347 RepID=A0A8J1U563_OWEFU|nr:unnamed protein product [Owenia fusiformis]